MTMEQRNESIGAQAPLAAPYDAFAGEASLDSQMGIIGRAKENIRQLGTSALDAIRHYSAGIATGHYLDQAKETLADKLPSRNQVLGVFAAGTAMAGGVSLETAGGAGSQTEATDTATGNFISPRSTAFSSTLAPEIACKSSALGHSASPQARYMRINGKSSKVLSVSLSDVRPTQANGGLSCTAFGKRSMRVYQRIETDRHKMVRNSATYTYTPDVALEDRITTLPPHKFKLETFRAYTPEKGRGVREVDFVVDKVWAPSQGQPSRKRLIEKDAFTSMSKR